MSGDHVRGSMFQESLIEDLSDEGESYTEDGVSDEYKDLVKSMIS